MPLVDERDRAPRLLLAVELQELLVALHLEDPLLVGQVLERVLHKDPVMQLLPKRTTC